MCTFSTNLSYTAFLTTSLLTTSLNLLKSTGTVTNLSISNTSTSVFKLTKFVFNAKPEVSTCGIFMISDFVALLDKSIFTLIFPSKLLHGLGKY